MPDNEILHKPKKLWYIKIREVKAHPKKCSIIKICVMPAHEKAKESEELTQTNETQEMTYKMETDFYEEF